MMVARSLLLLGALSACGGNEPALDVASGRGLA
jgi:hypothetical protein